LFKNNLIQHRKNLLIVLYQKMKLMRIVYNFGVYIHVKSKMYGDMVYSKRRISIKNLQKD
jgi:hypothetical protein